MEGWFFLVAALLVASGARKLSDPAPTAGALRAARLPSSNLAVVALAIAEIGAGGAAVLAGSSVAAFAVAAVYLAFAVFVLFALRLKTPLASCGCFGRADTPPTWIHLNFNLVAAAGALTLATKGTLGLPMLLADQPMLGIPYATFLALGVFCLYLLLSEVPLLLRRR